MIIKNIIFDLDGVFTDGTFYYSKKGKILKKFGSHDAQAINICKTFFNIQAITADRRGFAISKKRADDMQVSLTLVPESKRADWVKDNFVREDTALVVDSFTDIPCLKYAIRSFAPNNSHLSLHDKVTDMLVSDGGNGAVSEVLDKLLFEKSAKRLWEFL
jgi:YrbI family 3-deoxy-D-manno-octulosonate 8-phosphate phosphatase